MVSSEAAEAAEQAAFVAELYAIGALYLAGSLALLLLRSKWTWWFVLGIQVTLLGLAAVEGMLTDPVGWMAFSAIPLAILVGLVGIRVVPARLQRDQTPAALAIAAADNT